MGCCFSIVCCGSTPETPPAHLVGTWEGVASDQSKIQMIIDAVGNMEWTRTMKGISCSQIIAYVKYNHFKFPLTGWNRDVPDEYDYWHTESKLEGTNYAVYPFTRSWKLTYNPKSTTNSIKETISIWFAYEGGGTCAELTRTSEASTEKNPLSAAESKEEPV